jgi:hypothetical protein
MLLYGLFNSVRDSLIALSGIPFAVSGGIFGLYVAGLNASVSAAGVCDEATPAKQMSMSAELFSRSKRLLRMDMARHSSPNFDPPRRKTAPRAGSAQPRGREAGPPGLFDVRRWEVRVLGRWRVAMFSNRTQRQPRAAIRQKCSAAAKAGSRPAQLRRRDGSTCRSGRDGPRGRHDRPDLTAYWPRHLAAARWRVCLRAPNSARCSARGRTRPRAGTPAQIAPDMLPISNGIGTSPLSVTLRKSSSRQNLANQC